MQDGGTWVERGYLRWKFTNRRSAVMMMVVGGEYGEICGGGGDGGDFFYLHCLFVQILAGGAHITHIQSDEDARVRGFGGLGKKQKIFFVVRLRTLIFFLWEF